MITTPGDILPFSSSQVKLKPEFNNWFSRIVGGITIACLSLMGIILIMSQLDSGGPGWFFTLFWLAFYLAGVYFVGKMYLQNLLLGHVILTASSSIVRPGEEPSFSLYFPRKFRIRNLKIQLLKREYDAATEGYGYTDLQVIPVLSRDNLDNCGCDKPTVTFKVLIPPDAEPSTKPPQPGIVWDIRVTMKNGIRPNYKDNFRITVAPLVGSDKTESSPS